MMTNDPMQHISRNRFSYVELKQETEPPVKIHALKVKNVAECTAARQVQAGSRETRMP